MIFYYSSVAVIFLARSDLKLSYQGRIFPVAQMVHFDFYSQFNLVLNFQNVRDKNQDQIIIIIIIGRAKLILEEYSNPESSIIMIYVVKSL